MALMQYCDNLTPVLFIFFINAVAESIEPEWKEADIDVPWLSHYFDHEAKKETEESRVTEGTRGLTV